MIKSVHRRHLRKNKRMKVGSKLGCILNPSQTTKLHSEMVTLKECTKIPSKKKRKAQGGEMSKLPIKYLLKSKEGEKVLIMHGRVKQRKTRLASRTTLYTRSAKRSLGRIKAEKYRSAQKGISSSWPLWHSASKQTHPTVSVNMSPLIIDSITGR